MIQLDIDIFYVWYFFSLIFSLIRVFFFIRTFIFAIFFIRMVIRLRNFDWLVLFLRLQCFFLRFYFVERYVYSLVHFIDAGSCFLLFMICCINSITSVLCIICHVM